MKKDYIATIGLEIHAELKTASKMFCTCKNDPDEEKPNANICPICMGHPGTLPVLNKEAIKHVLKIGHAVNGTIADFTEWDRKNYFYPDIPKGYQISQYKYPLVSGGNLAGVDLTRIHLEEDTAQSTHDIHEKSLVNFNRSGVPLMELVTEPVIHDAETAVKFAKELQLLLRYIGAGKANLEKGEMRVEANISVASPEDTTAKKFGTKTEVKNLNSFKAVEKAIAFEITRQIDAYEKGEKVVQETRGWDENSGTTYSQRLKESSHDYRYFPEPDIPKLKISEVEEFNKEHLTKETPELPWIKRERFTKDYGMTEKEVAVFVEQPETGKYFEEVVGGDAKNAKIAKLATNYILTDYLGLLKKEGKGIEMIAVKNFSKLMKMIEEGKLSSRGAKDTLALMTKEDGDPEIIADKNGLIQKSDEGEIKKIVEEIISKNASVVEDYKNGKEVALQFLVGQGMKATKGSANPELLKKII
ncbi:MAG: aspartyl-tRNA(Asn)/glutamyl-tRNA(Gln) amidotransferase subunit [Patescibacteria group bacterium]|nr:aspartyl-tRNA(Asn)/glutamyl-tRNA(Gln) amidotransferase subunit [Patescibacteria group bacterium]